MLRIQNELALDTYVDHNLTIQDIIVNQNQSTTNKRDINYTI